MLSQSSVEAGWARVWTEKENSQKLWAAKGVIMPWPMAIRHQIVYYYYHLYKSTIQQHHIIFQMFRTHFDVKVQLQRLLWCSLLHKH